MKGRRPPFWNSDTQIRRASQASLRRSCGRHRFPDVILRPNTRETAVPNISGRSSMLLRSAWIALDREIKGPLLPYTRQTG